MRSSRSIPSKSSRARLAPHTLKRRLETEQRIFRDRHGRFRLRPLHDDGPHRAGPVEPPLRLTHLSFDEDGVLTYPRRHDTAPESALAGYLDEAAALFDSLPDVHEDGPTRVSDDFEHLRWFDLPAVCLEPTR